MLRESIGITMVQGRLQGYVVKYFYDFYNKYINKNEKETSEHYFRIIYESFTDLNYKDYDNFFKKFSRAPKSYDSFLEKINHL